MTATTTTSAETPVEREALHEVAFHDDPTRERLRALAGDREPDPLVARRAAAIAEHHPGAAAAIAEHEAGRAVIAAVAGDYSAAVEHAVKSIAYADALHAVTRCGRCGRTLTDPVSVTRGIGPDCVKKPR